jgi:hypothetical protein
MMCHIPQFEFDLHVWKRFAVGNRPDQYTIGIWDGQQIHSLCHIAPIEDAVQTLRQVLETAGQPAALTEQ